MIGMEDGAAAADNDDDVIMIWRVW